MPGGKRLEVVASWVNGMKADMTCEGVRASVRAPARHSTTGEPFDVRVVPGTA